MSEDQKYTIGERALAGAGLLIAAPGLLNVVIWQSPLLGLSPKQIATITIIPLVLIVYFVLGRPDVRSAQ